MKLFKKLLETLDPMMGKTVVHFTTHGCMGQIDEFDFIGTVVDTVYHDKHKFYKVEILKQGSNEKRNKDLEYEFAEVPSWYLQNIGGNFFVVYD